MGFPKCRHLKPNHGCEAPSHIAAITVETTRKRECNLEEDESCWHEFATARLEIVSRKAEKWYGRKSLTFNSPCELWQAIRAICQPKKPLWMFASDWHFVSQMCGLWDEIDQGKFTLALPKRYVLDAEGKTRTIPAYRGMLAIEKSPFVVWMVHKRGSVQCVDIRNYYPDYAGTGFCGGAKCDKPVLGVRAIDGREQRGADRQVEKLLECAIRLIDSWKSGDRGNFQPTAARLAMSNWRHEYMAEHDFCFPTEDYDRKFERSGYFGGEVRNWFKGQYHDSVFKVDINGLYASVMQRGVFPRSVRVCAPMGTPLGRSMPVRPDRCMAGVLVKRCDSVPVRQNDFSVSYPKTANWTASCGSELVASVNAGLVTEWNGWHEYELAPLFCRYVTYWWDIRVQAKAMGDTDTESLAKLMLNSLYGKFAAKRPKWEIVNFENPPVRFGCFAAPDRITGILKKHRAIAGIVQQDFGMEEKSDTFIAVSAFVTSAARNYVRKVRDSLPSRSVLAQQTDSFLLTQEGYDALRTSEWWGPTELGRFRLVEQLDGVTIWSGNQYVSNGVPVVAGLPERHERINECTYKTYRRINTGEYIGSGGLDGGRIITDTFRLGETRGQKQIYDERGWVI